MSETPDTDVEPVMLDPAADAYPEFADHPDELTPEEAERGKALYESIDDTDDDDNGLPT